MPSFKSILLLPIALGLAQLAAAHPLESRAAFTLKNGRDAIALNAKFAKMTLATACKTGENACIGNDFAQCSNGKFVRQPCAGGLVCRALPLVNSPGTSITCDTAADAKQRIATTGAASKRDFFDDEEDFQVDEEDVIAKRAAFTLQNGQDAIKLNAQFATLTVGSACTAGPNACVGDSFAQCVDNKYVNVGCAGGLVCRALPLVNSAGTSITCDTAADATARIATTGATGGAAPAVAAAAAPAPAPAPAPAAAVAAAAPAKAAGTQFITGPCSSDADCASGCCGFNTGKCAGAIIALQRDGGCGFGATPNDNAAKLLGFTGGITSASTGPK